MNKNITNLLAVDILIDGKPQKKLAHEGKTFIEAKFGQKYTIRLKNNSPYRILCVPSADGLNVIDGSTADPNGIGYILEGYSSYEIAGFRTSNDKVNAFEFAKKDESYAAKNDENPNGTVNCGVIGVLAYQEQPKITFKKNEWNLIDWDPLPFPKKPWKSPYSPEPYKPYWHYQYKIWSSTDPTKVDYYNENSDGYSDGGSYSVSSSNLEGTLRCANFDAGTKFSKEEITDKVVDGEFLRGDILGQYEIYYASRACLEAIGIKFSKEPEINFPTAFPGKKFCKPPTK